MSRNRFYALGLAIIALVVGGLWLRQNVPEPPAQGTAVTANIGLPARPASAPSVPQYRPKRDVDRPPALPHSPRPPSLFTPRQKQLSSEFIAAFHLIAGEAGALQEAFDAARTGLERRALPHATVRRPAADTLLVHVAPFDGTEALDELLNRLQTILGTERYRVFIAAHDFDMEVALHSFGAETRDIEIKRTPQGHYTVTDERTTPEHLIGDEPATFQTRAEMEAAIGQLVSLLPPDW